MAPISSKRSRPAFSPPRPGKSKPTKPSKTQSTTGSKKNTKTSGGGRVQKKTATKRPRQKKVSRGAAGTARAFLDEAADDDDEVDEEPEAIDRDSTGDEEEDQDEHRDSDEKSGDEEAQDAEELQSSPEPDFMLAEVTHSDDHTSDMLSSEPAITLPLIHRIMHTHFNDPEKTKIKPDAEVLVGKYVEIFVKEGIRRCVDEKKEREKSGGAGAHVDSGWLELEDLERVATQLCMDF